jgi:hypothetical protein
MKIDLGLAPEAGSAGLVIRACSAESLPMTVKLCRHSAVALSVLDGHDEDHD